MSIAQVLSRAQYGLDAPLVQIEAHLGQGLPGFSMVGLPAPVVRESRERVRSAILNAGYTFPASRITVNLAPVELSKEGGRYDLPIALALLIASGQLPLRRATRFECYGELGLGGDLRPVSGLLLAAIQAARAGHGMALPLADLPEVRLARHPHVFGFSHLKEVCAFLAGEFAPYTEPTPSGNRSNERQYPSLDEVKGQWRAKRTLVIAASGGHSLLMVGPPGSGKSMLAMRLMGLLPPLSDAEALEVAGVASISPQGFDPARWGHRPFRAPHHAASANAIIGGGSRLSAGEISLAHRGVLFMDELPEYDRRVLEALREPLESGAITLVRVSGRLELPAEFQLVAAMNPCPCGYYGDEAHVCRCGPRRIQRYRERISGPLLDRLDLHIEVPRVDMAVARLNHANPGLTGLELAARVCTARLRQEARQRCCNARLDQAGMDAHCQSEPPAQTLLDRVAQRFALSARGYSRILKVARTIADLDGAELIGPAHVSEAASLRLSSPAKIEADAHTH